MPFNIVAGNSAGYNYASSQSDQNIYYRSIDVDRDDCGAEVLDRIFEAWFEEAVLIEGYLPQEARTIDFDPTHQWFWDGREHADPTKAANAQDMHLKNHSTTYAFEYAKQGRDWESELRQRAKELRLMRKLGLFIPEPPATNPDQSPGEDTLEEDDDSYDADLLPIGNTSVPEED